MVNVGAAIQQQLPEIWKIRFRDEEQLSGSVLLRQKFGYFTPDEWYSAALAHYVNSDTNWLDVGCGRHILPQNPNLATILAKRCKSLTGIDPDQNVLSNPFLNQSQQCDIESFRSDTQFDLVSLRMVAEHIADPEAAVAALTKLVAPGGRIIIYTVWKWAPASVVAAVTPMSVHHWAKKILWDTEERDTFPVVYGMNTRKRLNGLFKPHGFQEELFLHLDDCRSFQRWKATKTAELVARAALRSVGFGYPENCLLAVFRRPA
jgi:SAM-dependent methyltransferase